MPVFAGLLGIVTFSSIGLPGLNGFIGEFLILLGAFKAGQFVFGALAATGVVLGAVYMLHMYKKVMFGKVTREENQNIKDMNQREILVLAPIILLIFWIGLYPMPFLRVMEPAVNDIVARLQVDAPGKGGSISHTAVIPQVADGERRADLKWDAGDLSSGIKE